MSIPESGWPRFIQVISSYRRLLAASREKHGPDEERTLGVYMDDAARVRTSSNEAVYAAWKNGVLTMS